MATATGPQVTEEDRLLAATYRAALPPIEQFIDDDFYCGEVTPPCEAQRQVLVDIFRHGAGYREVALAWGRRGGKSYLVSLAILYVAYRTLCLRDPQTYYGIGTGSPISIVNVSVTHPQAKSVVFGEVAGKIDKMPCFRQAGFQRNERIDSALVWPQANLTVHPSGSNPKGDLGANILLVVMDEAAWYEEVTYSVRQSGLKSEGRFDQAKALYDLLSPAVFETGNANWHRDALFFAISAPRYVDDYMERKIAEGRTDRHIYALRLPTWEGVPKARLCGRTFHDAVCGEVPVEYETYFTKDPEQARRNYGAVPSEAIGGFFSDPSVIERNANPDRGSPFLPDGQAVAGWSGRGKPALYVHVDLGLRRDACGMGAAYRDGDRVRVEFCKRVLPAEHGGEVDFEAIRQFIVNLRNVHGWQIACVSYDGWQSVESRQQLAKAGIHTQELSVDRNTEAYDTLKELILTGRLDYYADPVLVSELSRLELVKGKKVDHPPGGCFVGETRIPILDGTWPMIAELADGRETWVYSCRHDGALVPGRARGRLTKWTDRLTDVLLDTGAVVRCTPEHLWMLRDGRYRAAQDLAPDEDRLMPIGFQWPANGGYERLSNKDASRILTHHMVWTYFHGPLPAGQIVHHLDGCKTNNDPANLEVSAIDIHARNHTTKRHQTDEEYHQRVIAGAHRFNTSWEGRWKHGRALRRTTERREIARHGDGQHQQLLFPEERNHKVRAIVPVTLPEPVPVYDLEIQEFHNFALASGIFVHNSKDVADGVAGAVQQTVTLGRNRFSAWDTLSSEEDEAAHETA